MEIRRVRVISGGVSESTWFHTARHRRERTVVEVSIQAQTPDLSYDFIMIPNPVSRPNPIRGHVGVRAGTVSEGRT